ncbi:MAG: DNA-binding protein [Bryobacteraceae bacterium]
MDIIFLDASVLFSAAYRADAKFLELWQMSNIHLVSSLYASEEARRNLEEVEQRERLKTLLRAVKLISALPDRPLPEGTPLPPKEEPILLAAMAAQATHLLTSDLRHFGPYYDKIVEGVLIVSPAGYFKTRLLD